MRPADFAMAAAMMTAACVEAPPTPPPASPLVIRPLPPSSSPSAPAKASEPEPRPSYEVAVEAESTDGGATGERLSDAQLTGPMRDPAFLATCGATSDMKVTVKVVVRAGRAAGVSVFTSPSDPKVVACVDRQVRTFRWPVSPHADALTTVY